ncbi:LysR substrate-binding domain-containing protein [Ruania albidiflava]|uniref:LysR substrate-binding domain-containing protein n=1 Tax=Ruania albidiflava TaxID=366586 RepID=UPI0003B5FB47|nr:LysR substrate-binding domain-containing protein [Ruania albidiflava]
MPAVAFRLGYVPGVTPAKWVRTWQQRHELPLELVPLTHPAAAEALADGHVDAALLRPPVDRDTMSAIPLYTEVTVVVAAKEHPLAALDPEEQVTAADLAEETLLHPLDDVYAGTEHLPGTVLEHRPASTAEAIQLVSAGTGLLVAPLSLARLHQRRDLVHRPLAGAPGAPVLLAWCTDRTTDAVEDFIGIVRGRTVNSTRGRRLPADPSAGPDRTADRGRPRSPRSTQDRGGAASPGGHRRRPAPRGRRGRPHRRGRR